VSNTELTTTELLLIEQRVTNDGPNIAVAYILLIFLGIVSAHRFYLHRPVTAVLQIFSYLVLVGFLWLLIDLVVVPEMVREEKAKFRAHLQNQARPSSAEASPAANPKDHWAYRLGASLKRRRAA
jgi:TM2 domain-containing membrane protein YozV